ncbi:MAG TPA: GNAT family N-acetyltransferase [Chitinispirillaceae bacterium]|nr:GNAT family N-acetyltransferase [Chitinispirillaceae bacterium]
MEPFITNVFPDEKEWNECLERYPLHELEHTPEYLNPGFQTADFKIGVLRDGPLLAGFTPFEKRQDVLSLSLGDRSFFKFHFNVLRLVGREILLPDIGNLFDIITAIEQTVNKDQVFSFPNIAVDSSLYTALINNSTLQRKYYMYEPYERFPYYTITLCDSWENYLKQLSSKVRHELRRKVHRFDDLYPGSVVCQEFVSDENLQQFHSAVEEISSKSWQRKRCGRRVVDDISGSTRKRLQYLARNGYFRSYILYAAEMPVAFAYGLQYGGLYHLHEIAYDHTYEATSPGFVLLWHLLKNLHENNSPLRCTLGGGEARFKKELCNEKTMVSTLWIVPKTPLNMMKTKMHSDYSVLHHCIGNQFNKIGVKQKVLTWLRK